MTEQQQRRSNTSGRLYGSYPAKVESVEHPKGLFMAQVRLMGLWDSATLDTLPWAEFLLPLGCKPEAGQHIPVELGDIVWVDFPRSGDTRYPRITGSCYYAPDYKSHLPAGQPGKAAEGEPPAPEITLKDDLYSRFGISEYKTHTGAWGIVHVATGTRLEISEAGIVIHSEKDSFRSSTGKTVEKIGGDYEQSVKGAVKIAIDGAAELSASAITLKSGGAVSIEAGGAFNVKATKADFKLG